MKNITSFRYFYTIAEAEFLQDPLSEPCSSFEITNYTDQHGNKCNGKNNEGDQGADFPGYGSYGFQGIQSVHG